MILEKTDNLIEKINETILKYVSARYIYLFGSHAYGEPTDDSDVDIYVVVPDDVEDMIDLRVKIKKELRLNKVEGVDMILKRESVFFDRIEKFLLEKAVYNKGSLIYE